MRPDARRLRLLGRPVMHSLSPAMHNAGFAARGLNAVYVPIETAELDDFRGSRALQSALRGASVTIPFKRDILPASTRSSPSAAGGRRGEHDRASGTAGGSGINTDARRLSRTAAPADATCWPARRALVLGAGGAARARGRGARARRDGASRSQRGAAAAAADAAAAVGAEASAPGRRRAARSWDVLVNATPVGSGALPGSPMDGLPDSAGGLVYDLVYDPDPTALMRAAARRPGAPIGGLEMLVAQAERQFEIWTGQRPPADLFAQAAATAIRTRRGQRRISELRRESVQRYEADNVRRIRGAGTARHLRARGQGNHGGPADAGLRVPEDRRALRLRLPVRERRRGRAGRALFVPRQGSIPRPARARRQDGHRTVGGDDGDRRAVHRRAAPADGGVSRAVRARICRDSPAAPSGYRLRRGDRVRAGAGRGVDHARRGRRTGRRDGRATTPASCCSTRCWRSITSSTAS